MRYDERQNKLKMAFNGMRHAKGISNLQWKTETQLPYMDKTEAKFDPIRPS